MSTIEPHADSLKSLDYYNQILESSIDVIYLMNVTPDGRFVYLDVNAAYTEVTGIPREAVIGLCVEKIENDVFRTILIDKFTFCLNAGTKTDYITEYPFPAGIRTFHSTLSPIRDENGRIHRIVGIARDITEQKRDEERLRNSEEAFRTLAEHSPDVIVRYDREYRRIYANPAFARLSGFKPEALLKKTPLESSPIIAPNYYMAELAKVIENGTSAELEIAIFHSNGEMKWYMASLVPEFGTLEVSSVLCVARDITEAKQYESMLQKSAHLEKTLSRMAANLPGFVYTLRRSPDGRAGFPYAGSGIYPLFGLHPENVAEDMSILQNLIHADDRPLIENAIARSASEMAPCAVTFRTQIPGREERWIEAKATPQKETDGSGDILWHGVMLDVTERIREQRERAMLEYFLDRIKEEVFLMREDGQFVYVNQEACRVLGYTREELLAWGVPDVDPDYHAERWNEHWADLEANGSRVFETSHVTKEGRIVPVEVHANHFIFDGIGYNLSIVHDITERKTAHAQLERKEASLREAQKLAKMGSWELQFPEQNLIWSDEIYRIFEIDPGEYQPSYDFFLSTVHPDDRESVDTAYTGSLKNKTPYEIIHRLLMKDGRVKYVHERGETLYDAQGNPLRSIGTVQDITEQKIEYRNRRDNLKTIAEGVED